MQALGASSAKSVWSPFRTPSLASGRPQTVSSPYSYPRARSPRVRTRARGSDEVVFVPPLQPAATTTSAISTLRTDRRGCRIPAADLVLDAPPPRGGDWSVSPRPGNSAAAAGRTVSGPPAARQPAGQEEVGWYGDDGSHGGEARDAKRGDGPRDEGLVRRDAPSARSED